MFTGEANTDRLNELPAPILMEWRDYIDLRNGAVTGASPGDGKTWLSPDKAMNILKERFGNNG